MSFSFFYSPDSVATDGACDWILGIQSASPRPYDQRRWWSGFGCKSLPTDKL